MKRSDRRTRATLAVLMVLLVFSTGSITAAGLNLSVPLEHPVYQLLESAQLRGLIPRLSASKPYSYRSVRKSLQLLEEQEDGLSQSEQRILRYFLEGLTEDERADVPVTLSGILETGRISYADEHLSAAMGAQIQLLNGISTGTDGFSYGTEDFLNLYLAGDLGTDLPAGAPELSYRFDMGFGVVSIAGQSSGSAKLKVFEQTAFAPYTFTPEWDGYSYSLLDPFNNVTGDEGVYIAFSMDPEISGYLFDDRLRLSLSRIPRNIGLGEDSLLLSGQAPPFVTAALEAKIFNGIDYTFLVGALENYGDSNASSALQSMITIHSVDVRPTDWLYLGVHEAVVWPKRFELGYLNPMIFSSLYQGQIGDYDNIFGGLSAGVSIPKTLDVYASFYFDEFSPTSFSDLFERVRNFFSYQAGMKLQISDLLPYGVFTAQYSKIEPFTYTHPATDVPWVDSKSSDGKVYESFVSGGYGIPSKLDPNSDELLIQVETQLLPRLHLSASYQMIRHGEYGGDYNSPLDAYRESDDDNGILPEGMEYPLWLDGAEESDTGSVGTLLKSFLHDGNYDWYHMGTLAAGIDISDIVNFPFILNVSDTLVYQFTTDHDVQLVEGSKDLTNFISIGCTLY